MYISIVYDRNSLQVFRDDVIRRPDRWMDFSMGVDAPGRWIMKTATDLMTENVLTVTPETPVAKAAEMILDHGITALPVVDGEGKLVGIVSEDDLVRCTEAKRDVSRS